MGSIVGPILFDVFIKDLEDTLSNFTDTIKLSAAVDVLLVELPCKETWTGLRKGLEGILGSSKKPNAKSSNGDETISCSSTS